MRLPDHAGGGPAGGDIPEPDCLDPLEATAIVAHYLVDSAAVIVGTAARLRDHGAELTEAERHAQLALVEAHGMHVGAVLAGLARGQAVDALLAIVVALEDRPELALPPNRARVPRVRANADDRAARPRSPLVELLGLDLDFDGRPPSNYGSSGSASG